MYPRSPRPLELWLWRHLPGKTDDGPLEQHDVFRWISNTRHPLEGACRPAAQSPDIASGTTAPCRPGAARPCIARGRRPSRLPARHSAAKHALSWALGPQRFLQATASAETKEVRKPRLPSISPSAIRKYRPGTLPAETGSAPGRRQEEDSHGPPVRGTLYANDAGGRPCPLRAVPQTPSGEDSP